jgi:exonuclease SbcC
MIERLRLRNFRRYRDATLTFQSGVNLIEGLNNVGKTSLFFAVEYALFGRVENFKTIRALMPPGKRSLGVEIVFVGRTGERYRLQRAHILPPKSKKALEGHFTLKALVDGAERYLLASDFGDTEDKLALKLHEITGLTRRFFSIAMHMRQGEIAAILEGSKQLDIVLGVTAASLAEDELRQMALELEKESARLPVLEERLRTLGSEMTKLSAEAASLSAERQQTADRLDALGQASDPRGELEKGLAPLLEAIAAFQILDNQKELARRRVRDEQERHETAIKAGSLENVNKELLRLEPEAKTRATTVKKLQGDLNALDAEQRKLDNQRGDLAGRIERRKGLPSGKGAKCEMCGAAIKPAQTAKELAKWTEDLEKLDHSLADFQSRQTKLRAELDAANTEERKQVERQLQLKKQREALAELQENLKKREKEQHELIAGAAKAYEAIEAQAKETAAYLANEKYECRWDLTGEPAQAIVSIREAIQSLRQSLAERVGMQLAERQALTDLLKRFDSHAESLGARQSEREREQAAALGEANALQVKAARAARFRGMSNGFKELQVQIRSEAAVKLGEDTLALHRLLSERDEFETLSIDPAHYLMQVRPRDLGEEVPAGLYEGGGHRLLLGLAMRLAVSQLVDQTPFLLLDEPTYGLDVAHREALLHRLGTLDLARQILLVTHHARNDLLGNRVHLVRQDRETVVGPANAPGA